MRFRALASVLLLAAAAIAQQKAEDCTVVREKDGSATVSGVVRQNDQGCALDGGRLLRLSCQGTEIHINYTQVGDMPEATAENRRAIASGAVNGPQVKAAWGVRAGERIEAHGLPFPKAGKIASLRIYYDNCWLKILSSEGAGTIAADPPKGPDSGVTGTPYTYTLHAVSSFGHAIRYGVEWSDASGIDWQAPGVTTVRRQWTRPGTYQVRTIARCEDDWNPKVISEPLTVTIR